MFHYFEAITNTSGDSLIGYFARVVDPATQNTVTISADDNGTPIVTTSGVENAAVTDAYGNLDFYVAPGTYHLDIYAPNATSLILRVQNVSMNSTKGDQGDPGPKGDTGEGLEDVMAPEGASLVGFRQDFGGAVTRTTLAKARERVSVLDFGADPTGATDSTAAFNLATGAAGTPATSNANALVRTVLVPFGRYKINGTVYVRRGQVLFGEGYAGVYIDLSDNSGKAFVLGQAAAGVDLGGLGVMVQNIFTIGGAPGQPVFDASTPDSWKIKDCMITEAGIGIRAGGTDGKIIDNIIDGGLTGIQFIASAPYGCHSHICSLNKFFNPVNAIRVMSGASDILITGNLIQFTEIAAVEITGTDISNVQINGNQIIANAQYEDHVGEVFLNNCTNASVSVSNNTFRNPKGLAVAYGGGLGINISFTGNVIDGLKDPWMSPSSQSVTAGGIEFSNMTADIANNWFRNLPGPSLFCSPSSATRANIRGNRFSGNTGGATELQLTGANGASTITVAADNSSDRSIVPAQTGIPVFANRVSSGRATLSAGQVVIALPLVRSSSRVSVMRYQDGGTVAASYSVSRNAGTGFTIQAKDGAGANQALDTSIVDWSVDLMGL